MDTLKEFIVFLMSNKKYWLVPVFLVMFLLGFLIYASAGSVIAPFIYTVF